MASRTNLEVWVKLASADDASWTAYAVDADGEIALTGLTAGETYDVSVPPDYLVRQFVADSAATISVISDVTINGGETFSVTPTYGGTNRVYEVSGAPFVSVNPSTGVISGAAAPNANATFSIAASVRNASGTATSVFALTVNEVVVGGDFTTEPMIGVAGSSLRMIPDFDPDPTVVSLTGAPAGMSVDQFGRITYNPPAGTTFSGDVTVEADGFSAPFAVAVAPAPVPPLRSPRDDWMSGVSFVSWTASWNGRMAQYLIPILRQLSAFLNNGELKWRWGEQNTPGSNPGARWYQGVTLQRGYNTNSWDGSVPFIGGTSLMDWVARIPLAAEPLNLIHLSVNNTGASIGQIKPAPPSPIDPTFEWIDPLTGLAVSEPATETEVQTRFFNALVDLHGGTSLHSFIGRLALDVLQDGGFYVDGEPTQKAPEDITAADLESIIAATLPRRDVQRGIWQNYNAPPAQKDINSPVEAADHIGFWGRLTQAWLDDEAFGGTTVRQLVPYAPMFWGGVRLDPDFVSTNPDPVKKITEERKARNAFLEGHPGIFGRFAWSILVATVLTRRNLSDAGTWPAPHLLVDHLGNDAWAGVGGTAASVRDEWAALRDQSGAGDGPLVSSPLLMQWLCDIAWRHCTDINDTIAAQAANIRDYGADGLTPSHPYVAERGKLTALGAPEIDPNALPATVTIETRPQGDVDPDEILSVTAPGADEAWTITPIQPNYGVADTYQFRSNVGGTPGEWSPPILIEQIPAKDIQIVDAISFHNLNTAQPIFAQGAIPAGAVELVSNVWQVDFSAMTGSTGDMDTPSAPQPGDLVVALMQRQNATVNQLIGKFDAANAFSRFFPTMSRDARFNPDAASNGLDEGAAICAGVLTADHLTAGRKFRFEATGSPSNVGATIYVLRGADPYGISDVAVAIESGSDEYGRFVFVPEVPAAEKSLVLEFFRNSSANVIPGPTETYITPRTLRNTTNCWIGSQDLRVNGPVVPAARYDVFGVPDGDDRAWTFGGRAVIAPAGTVTPPAAGPTTGRINTKSGRYYFPVLGATPGQVTQWTAAWRMTLADTANTGVSQIFRIGSFTNSFILLRDCNNNQLDLRLRADDGAGNPVLFGAGFATDIIPGGIVDGEEYSVMMSYDAAAVADKLIIRIEGPSTKVFSQAYTGTSAFMAQAANEGGLNTSAADCGVTIHESLRVWETAVDPRDDAVFGVVFDGANNWAARKVLTSHGSEDFGAGTVLPSIFMHAPNAATWNMRYEINAGVVAEDAP